jgi:hypothetical protein
LNVITFPLLTNRRGVLFSGQPVLKLRIKSTVANHKRDLQGQTERLRDLSREKLAATLLVICVTLIAIATLYALITIVFAEINPVAVAGLAWFKKTS